MQNKMEDQNYKQGREERDYSWTSGSPQVVTMSSHGLSAGPSLIILILGYSDSFPWTMLTSMSESVKPSYKAIKLKEKHILNRIIGPL